MPVSGTALKLRLSVLKAKYLQKKGYLREQYDKLQKLRTNIGRIEKTLDDNEDGRSSSSFSSGSPLLPASDSDGESGKEIGKDQQGDKDPEPKVSTPRPKGAQPSKATPPPPSQARGCPTCVPRPKRQAGPWPSHPLFLPAEVVLSTLLRSRLELKLQRQQLAETRRRPTTWATPTRPANCTRVFRLATRSGAKPVTNSEGGSFASQRATGNRCASGHPCRRSVSPEYVAVQPKQLPVLSVLSILVQLRR